ncbi:MAG TPA: AMP-binding protein [Burkholderiales bacterium]|nr:AMP-binding protein [Burkholderiales bacterium]
MTTTPHNETLASLLLERLATEPQAEICRLVRGDGNCDSVTVERLMRKAMAYAEYLGPVHGRRKIVGISLYHGLDLHAAFIGGLLSGHIPTMLAPPSPRMERGKYASAFRQMVRHIEPDHLVVDKDVYRELETLDLAEASSVLVDAGTIPDRGDFAPCAHDPDGLALIQHSSGTTGLQKGVGLTHRAILAHHRLYSSRLDITPRDVIVSWLPLYHDMGFMACFLLPLMRRVLFVEMSPFDWVRQPGMLLEQIHKHRGTLCWMPNFAYSFLAESVRQVPEELDLSSMRAWINCSEPVYHSSHKAFLARFGRYGADRSQLSASYAMAENVFAVTQSLPGEYRELAVNRQTFMSEHRAQRSDKPDALTFVSNGRVLQGTEVAVADDAGGFLEPGCVGELWVRGIHRFSEYFGRADLTASAMTEHGWYRTGDLGFVFENELYVTGRKKELLIIQGRNFYPADIEDVVGRIEGVAPGRVVAFGIADEASGTERLTILAEADNPAPGSEKRLALTVRNRVAQELDCTPGDVRIVPSRWLIKSTSGKLARTDNRRKYIEQFTASKLPQ